MLGFLKKLFSRDDTPIREMLSKGAIILDVRTQSEYRGGHVKGSMHIPLDQLSREAKKVQKLGKPVVTCCASGRRSGIAADMLSKMGVQVINGGSWSAVDRLKAGN